MAVARILGKLSSVSSGIFQPFSMSGHGCPLCGVSCLVFLRESVAKSGREVLLAATAGAIPVGDGHDGL